MPCRRKIVILRWRSPAQHVVGQEHLCSHAGTVGRNFEVVDDKLGFFASDEQNPQKSRILLSLALRRQRAPGEMQKRFLTY